MIQIKVSKTLAKPLSKHLKPLITQQPDLLWRADVIMVGADTCIVLQEQYTQYLMVICGLDKADFSEFPDFFRERFCREMMAICKQANLYDDRTLLQHLSALCAEPSIALDPDPLEEGPISNTFERLERRFLHDHEPLPTDGRSAFKFSFPLNTQRPKQAADNIPVAAENLGNLCLNLIEEQLENTAPKIISEQDNIVRVDFARHRNP